MSPPFSFTGPNDPEDMIYPDQSGTHVSVADGFWVILEPLPPGQHTISFRGKAVFPAVFPALDVFETTVTYHVTVQ